jgi:hypothetical protein
MRLRTSINLQARGVQISPSSPRQGLPLVVKVHGKSKDRCDIAHGANSDRSQGFVGCSSRVGSGRNPAEDMSQATVLPMPHCQIKQYCKRNANTFRFHEGDDPAKGVHRRPDCSPELLVGICNTRYKFLSSYPSYGCTFTFGKCMSFCKSIHSV